MYRMCTTTGKRTKRKSRLDTIMKKSIIFDLGNVVLNFDPLGYLRTKFADEETIGRVYDAVFRSREWIMLDEGVITEEEALQAFCRRHPAVSMGIKAAMDNWYGLLEPVASTVEYIRELKDNGFNAYYLSNFHKAASEYVLANHDFFNLFDGGIFSFEERLIKPDIRIYRKMLEKYDLRPEDCLFIDDVGENVDGAEKAGIKSVLFLPGCDLKTIIKWDSL